MREMQNLFVRAAMLCLAFVISAFALVAEPLHVAVIEPLPSQSDIESFSFGEGRYYIDGKAPKGFTEFEYLYLEGGTFNLGPDRKRLVSESHGGVKGEMYGRLKFKMKRVFIDGDTITFETQAVRGISFQFSGIVFNAATERNEPITAGLKGRLSKWLNGKRVAEAQVTFDYLEPED